MQIEPNGISQWGYEDVIVDRRMTIDNPSAKLLRAVGHAEAAGEVLVKLSAEEKAKLGKVESDADSMKALRKAVESGDWQYGSHEAFLVHAEHLLADEDLELSDETRATLEHGVKVSTAYLDHRDAGLHHENAVRQAVADVGGSEAFLIDDEKELARIMKQHAEAVDRG